MSWRIVLFGGAWIASLALAGLGGVLVHKYRTQLRALLRSVQSSPILVTNLYNLSVRKLKVPALGRDGGIAVLGNGLLFANRDGAMWYVDSAMALHPLPSRVPVGVGEFLADPSNAGVTFADRFSVKDLLVRPRPGGVQVLASHLHWDATRDCNTLRVSSLDTDVPALLSGAEVADSLWRVVFETTPCLPLGMAPDSSRHPTLGAGGRLALLGPDSLLVTVGGFVGENEMPPPALYWDAANSFGKTHLIDLTTGRASVFTVGHRNPQGLAVTSAGDIWLTEHAARGGDELNRLVRGRNYGYPAVSYGTAYGAMTWPSNPRQGHHDGYEKPRFVWVPSIGISQLVVLEGDGFPLWKGDVMVASLGAEQLFRVRFDDGHVMFVEPMRLEQRVRDMVEASDGTLVLKTDDDFLVFIRPVGADAEATAAMSPAERGQVLASACMGCHTFEPGGASGIGPNLSGVVGRSVASQDGYAYSAALRGFGGRWTEERLRRYIAAPATAVPGTSMLPVMNYDDGQLDALLAYLRTLR